MTLIRTRRVLWVGLFLGSVALVDGQNIQESSPPKPDTLQKSQAAMAYAAVLGRPGTPEYMIAFRRALALAHDVPVTDTAADRTRALVIAPGAVDSDLRYQKATLQMQRDQLRIWGGEPVDPGMYPDTVAITGSNGLCSGTLISQGAVLTAAHCFCHGVKTTVYFGDGVNSAFQTVGVRDGKAMMSCTAPLTGGDLAVLFLSQNVAIQPRSLAPSGLIDAATSVRLVGYGATQNPIMDPVGIKRRVDVPVASAACAGKVTTPAGAVPDSTYYGCAPGKEIVAGAEGLDKDSCNGDSGGPLFVPDASGALSLAGATSRPTGPPGLRPCGDGGVYVRITPIVVQWLRSVGVAPVIAVRR